MIGFMNFIVTFACITFCAVLARRALNRRRARHIALVRAEDEWTHRTNRLNAVIDEIPPNVIGAHNLARAEVNGNTFACDALDAALQVELNSPSNEGEIAHLREGERTDFIESAALALGMLAVKTPRRWSRFTAVLPTDPSLAARAAMMAHVTQ